MRKICKVNASGRFENSPSFVLDIKSDHHLHRAIFLHSILLPFHDPWSRYMIYLNTERFLISFRVLIQSAIAYQIAKKEEEKKTEQNGTERNKLET
jgi:hypothetical protein